MPNRKRITLPELLKRVDDMHIILLQQGKTLELQGRELQKLQNRAIAEDAARKAVAEYKSGQRNDDNETWLGINKELIKVIGVLAGAIVVALTIIKTSK